jgi:ATP-dependent Clp protease ATP-binding subunit ClpC
VEEGGTILADYDGKDEQLIIKVKKPKAASKKND